jgi:hypothetical protein
MKSDVAELQTPRETLLQSSVEQYHPYEIPIETVYQVFDARADVGEDGGLTATIVPDTDGHITMGAEFIFTTVEGEPFHWGITTELEPGIPTVIHLLETPVDVEFASWRLIVNSWDSDEDLLYNQ